MKKYEKPEVQVCAFASEDFITVSGGLKLYHSGTMTQGENTINF